MPGTTAATPIGDPPVSAFLRLASKQFRKFGTWIPPETPAGKSGGPKHETLDIEAVYIDIISWFRGLGTSGESGVHSNGRP